MAIISAFQADNWGSNPHTRSKKTKTPSNRRFSFTGLLHFRRSEFVV